jgi:hypothetical protein
MEKFPRYIPGWGNDMIASNLQVEVRDTETGETEEIRLTAVLELRRGKIGANTEGAKTMDIRIKRWTARGRSELLDKEVEFIVQTGKGQPMSEVVANQPNADFPATMTFNVISDMYVGDDPVVKSSRGVAVNRAMTTIPPLGTDKFEVHKEGTDVADGAAYGRFRIRPVACFNSNAVVRGHQKLLFGLGRRLNFVSEEVYRKTLFKK